MYQYWLKYHLCQYEANDETIIMSYSPVRATWEPEIVTKVFFGKNISSKEGKPDKIFIFILFPALLESVFYELKKA